MKKTVTINLGGRAFLITEEAYNSLEDYLSSLATTFKEHESAEEIIADIEARISELCEKRLAQSHGEIIELALVNEMINRMGKPEAMLDEENDESNTQHTAQEEENTGIENNTTAGNIFEKMQLNKKYCLDGEDRMVGGVISGLAAYLKIDVTILRIVALVAIIATGLLGIVAYFAVWCIAPTAGNTSEKLRMQGIEPTPENIAEKIIIPIDKSKHVNHMTVTSQSTISF
jgi:phage shock protein PspC (stress-responsive transcriptional regulator)